MVSRKNKCECFIWKFCGSFIINVSFKSQTEAAPCCSYNAINRPELSRIIGKVLNQHLRRAHKELTVKVQQVSPLYANPQASLWPLQHLLCAMRRLLSDYEEKKKVPSEEK